MKNITIILLIICSCATIFQARAQSEAKKHQIGFYAGMASYGMTDLKNLNSQYISQFPFEDNLTLFWGISIAAINEKLFFRIKLPVSLNWLKIRNERLFGLLSN